MRRKASLWGFTLIGFFLILVIAGNNAFALQLGSLPELYINDTEANMGTYGPQLKKLPDIFIGDMEDFGTYDLNFFRFPNAIDIDRFVFDADTPDSDLRWSFWEGGNPDWLLINGIAQIDPLTEDPLNPGPKDIRHPSDPQYLPGNLIDLWDIKDSPGPPPNPPYPDPTDPLDEIVTFFVSDGTFLDSEQLRIVAQDDDYDSVEGWSNVQDYYFEGDTDGWIFIPLSASTRAHVFTSAASAFNGRALGVVTDNLTNRFSCWTAPVDVLSDNKLFKFVWRVSTSQASKRLVPITRLRVNETLVNYACTMVIRSAGLTDADNPFMPPLWPATRDYNLYLLPLTTGNLRPSFDVYDFDHTAPNNDSGTNWLDTLWVFKLNEPTTGWTAEIVPPFDSWSFGHGFPRFNIPGTSRTSTSLTLSTPFGENFAFGYWYSPLDGDFTFIPDTLYRVKCVISSPDPFPDWAMVRVNSTDLQVAYRLIVYPGAAQPTPTGKIYPLFFETHEYVAGNDRFWLNFELCDFNIPVVTRGANTLSAVTVDRRPVP